MDMNQLTRIFCDVDDFCKELNQYRAGKLLPSPSGVIGKRGPACCLDDNEIMTILIFFQSSCFRNFKIFYTDFLCRYWKKEFPKLPSYNRFIEIMNRVIFHLVLFSQINSGKRTGIYYIDQKIGRDDQQNVSTGEAVAAMVMNGLGFVRPRTTEAATRCHFDNQKA